MKVSQMVKAVVVMVTVEEVLLGCCPSCVGLLSVALRV